MTVWQAAWFNIFDLSVWFIGIDLIHGGVESHHSPTFEVRPMRDGLQSSIKFCSLLGALLKTCPETRSLNWMPNTNA